MTPGARPRPHRLRRFLAALLGAVVLLLGATQDGYGLRPCAHHDQPDAGGHAHGESPGTSGGTCTCVGACTVGGSVPVLPGAPASLVLLGGVVHERVEPLEASRVSTPIAFFLPYANGPPAS